MPFKVLADLVVLTHFIWIIFLLTGAIWGRRHRLVKALHLGGLGFAIIMQIMGWYCPLTHLEYWLRLRHDPGLTYRGSFLIHYVEQAVYLELSTGAVLLLTLGLCGLNAWVYLRKSSSNI